VELPVVVKAKTFTMKTHSNYIGNWHCEGVKDQVTGVGLLYYDIPDLFTGNLEFRPKFISYCFNDRRYFFGIDDARVSIKNGSFIVFKNDEVVHRVGDTINFSRGDITRSYLSFFICSKTAFVTPPLWKKECMVKCRDLRYNARLLARILRLDLNFFPLPILERICLLAKWNDCFTEEVAETILKKIGNFEKKKKQEAKDMREDEPWGAVDGGIMRFCN